MMSIASLLFIFLSNAHTVWSQKRRYFPDFAPQTPSLPTHPTGSVSLRGTQSNSEVSYVHWDVTTVPGRPGIDPQPDFEQPQRNVKGCASGTQILPINSPDIYKKNPHEKFSRIPYLKFSRNPEVPNRDFSRDSSRTKKPLIGKILKNPINNFPENPITNFPHKYGILPNFFLPYVGY